MQGIFDILYGLLVLVKKNNNEPINIQKNSSEIKFTKKTLSTANMKKRVCCRMFKTEKLYYGRYFDIIYGLLV
jgi:hypothetical protein